MSQKNGITKHQEKIFEDNINKSLVKQFNKHLTICYSSTTKLKPNKFKNQHGHCKNVHVLNSKTEFFLYKTETNKLNKKNKFQDKFRIAQHSIKNTIQEQDKKSSFSNNSKGHNTPPHFILRNKNINRSNNQNVIFKDEHKFMTSKLDWQI